MRLAELRGGLQVNEVVKPRLATPTFLAITLASFAYFVAYGVGLPVLPVYAERQLLATETGVGIAVGAFSITAFALRPWVGRAGDRRGMRVLLVGGAVIVGVSTLLYAGAESVGALVVLRLVGGVGEAMFFVGASSAIADIAPPARRGEALSYFTVSLYGGLAVGPVLGETVLDAMSFGAVWVLSAALCAVAATLALRAPGAETVTLERDADPPRLIHPAGVLPGLIMLTSVWGFAGYAAFVPLYVEDVGLDGARLVLLVYASVIMLVRLVGARIPDVFGADRAGRAALMTSTAGLLVIGVWRSPLGLFAGSIVFALGQALAFPAFMTLVSSSVPHAERGAAVGTFTAFIDLAFFLGAVSAGVAAELWGSSGAFLAAAAVSAAGVMMTVLAGDRLADPRARATT